MITISEHLIKMGEMLDTYRIPDSNRKVKLTQSQYDELKKELTGVFGTHIAFQEYPNIKPKFDRFTIEVINNASDM